MKEDNTLPVLFFAFANDKTEDGQYLEELDKELSEIEEAMFRVDGTLCKVEVRANCTADDIIRIFNKYPDRIVLFHYGGHAEKDLLHLRAKIGKNIPIWGDGLISFLSRQKGLEIVFLNACVTREMTHKLLSRRGPSVVMGTDKAIQDGLARSFAVAFYSSIAQNIPLKRAWENAKDRIRMENREGMWRGLKAGLGSSTIPVPWVIKIADGAEQMNDWCLALQSKNPLFDLRLPSSYYDHLPESPFRKLLPYGNEHAAIFFGRDQEIRKLYNASVDFGGAPVILFYGASGSGKSSILDAGFRPRAKDHFRILYARRNKEIGLRETFLQLLKQEYLEVFKERFDPDAHLENLESQIKKIESGLESLNSLKDQLYNISETIESTEKELNHLKQSKTLSPWQFIWQRFEKKTDPQTDKVKPLLIILDQVEEAYTDPLSGSSPQEELNDLTEAIAEIFQDTEDPPLGKILLGFRKEYLTEIEETFIQKNIDRKKIPLADFQREQIIEVIKNLESKEPKIQEKYSIKVKPDFPQFVADQLETAWMHEDKQESPLAPVLQILLDKMWEKVKNRKNRFFDHNLFGDVDGMTWMSAFLDEHIAKLNQPDSDVVSSGLLIDLLYKFVTVKGTSALLRASQLEEWYPHRLDAIKDLLEKLETNMILLKGQSESELTYRLVHDSLAKPISDRFSSSTLPGQMATRILKNVGTEEHLDREEFLIVINGERGRTKYTNENDIRIIRKNWEKKIVSVVRDQISKDKLRQVFHYFEVYHSNEEAVTRQDDSLWNSVIMVMAQYNKLKRDENMGVVLNQDLSNARFTIIQSLLEICNKIELANKRRTGKRAKELLLQGNEQQCFQILKEYIYELDDPEHIILLNGLTNYWDQYHKGLLSGPAFIKDSPILNKIRFFLLKICNQFIGHLSEKPNVSLPRTEPALVTAKVRDLIMEGNTASALQLMLDAVQALSHRDIDLVDELNLLMIRFNSITDYIENVALYLPEYFPTLRHIATALYEISREFSIWSEDAQKLDTSAEEKDAYATVFRKKVIHLMAYNQLRPVIPLLRNYMQQFGGKYERYTELQALETRLQALESPSKILVEKEELVVQRNRIRFNLIEIFFELSFTSTKNKLTKKQESELVLLLSQVKQYVLVEETQHALELLLYSEQLLSNEIMQELFTLSGRYHHIVRSTRMGWLERADQKRLLSQINQSFLAIISECLHAMQTVPKEWMFQSALSISWSYDKILSAQWKNDLESLLKMQLDKVRQKNELETVLKEYAAFTAKHQLVTDREVTFLLWGYNLYRSSYDKGLVTLEDHNLYLRLVRFSLEAITNELLHKDLLSCSLPTEPADQDKTPEILLQYITEGNTPQALQALLKLLYFQWPDEDFWWSDYLLSLRKYYATLRAYWMSSISTSIYLEELQQIMDGIWNQMETVLDEANSNAPATIKKDKAERPIEDLLTEARNLVAIDNPKRAIQILLDHFYQENTAQVDELIILQKNLIHTSLDQTISVKDRTRQNNKIKMGILEFCSTALKTASPILPDQFSPSAKKLDELRLHIRSLVKASNIKEAWQYLLGRGLELIPELKKESHLLTGSYYMLEDLKQQGLFPREEYQLLYNKSCHILLELTERPFIIENIREQFSGISTATEFRNEVIRLLKEANSFNSLYLLKIGMAKYGPESFSEAIHSYSRYVATEKDWWLARIKQEEFRATINMIHLAVLELMNTIADIDPTPAPPPGP